MNRGFAMPTRSTAVILPVLLLIAHTCGTAGQAQDGVPRAAKGDWPWWRGPSFDNSSVDRGPVMKWSSTEHVIWKTPVPGRGHSSPIVVGNHVFLTSADDDAQQQFVLAFDRQSGKTLWRTVVREGDLARKYFKNSYASATPACDGERLYTVFLNKAGLFVTALDRNGKKLWQTNAGSFQSEHGYGSSPVLYKSLIIVNGDNLKSCFLTALDVRTGAVVWQTERPVTGKHGSYGSPIIARLAGKPQLLQSGMGITASYEPETGKRLWSAVGPAEVTGNTVAWNENLVITSGGFPEKNTRAIRADGAGDVSQSHVAWSSSKATTYVPSPLCHGDKVFIVNDGGIASCLEAASGKEVWQERLEGAFSSSPVLVSDLIYATNEAGTTFVFKAARAFELVAKNSLKEAVMATPAFCGEQIFLRTAQHLYCLGKPSQPRAP